MGSDSDKPKRWQFSLRAMFVLLLLIGVGTGWAVDRARLVRQRLAVEERLRRTDKAAKLLLLEKLNADAWGKPVDDYPEIVALADGIFDENSEHAGLYQFWDKLKTNGKPALCHFFGIAREGEQLKEGEPYDFMVFTCEGKIIHIEVESAVW